MATAIAEVGLGTREAGTEITMADAHHMLVARAERLVADYHSDSLPINVEMLARQVGIGEITEADITACGMLLPTANGHALTLSRSNGPQRRRFTCAHEIGHALLAEFETKLSRSEEAAGLGNGLANSRVERLCDIAARHILMPEHVFRRRLVEIGVSVDASAELAKVFDTSNLTTALRVVETSPLPLVMIVSEVFGRPESVPKLRVRWSARNTERFGLKRYFVPRNLPIYEGSITYQAYVDKAACRGLDSLKMGNLKGTYYVESRAFRSNGDRYVVSFVFPEAQSARLI